MTVGRDSVVGTAIRHGLDGPGIESWWGRDFHTGPGANPATYTMGTGSFQGEKRPGRGVDHSPSIAVVKGIVELYISSHSGPSWPVLGQTLPLSLSVQVPIGLLKYTRSMFLAKHDTGSISGRGKRFSFSTFSIPAIQATQLFS